MSEPNEHAKRLLLVADLLERRGDSIGALGCEKAAAEIERLEADRDSWKKQAEIQAESLRHSNDRIERLEARVRELEELQRALFPQATQPPHLTPAQ